MLEWQQKNSMKCYKVSYLLWDRKKENEGVKTELFKQSLIKEFETQEVEMRYSVSTIFVKEFL